MTEPWSVRQMAVYHQITDERDDWILISASKAAENQVDDFLKMKIRYKQLDYFQLHLALVRQSLANWRYYLEHLTERATYQVRSS
jgi:hypothetical protein